MHKVTCETCHKQFSSKLQDADECYDCALERFSGGGAPEEGDFNSAQIVSGEEPYIQFDVVDNDEPYWLDMLDDEAEHNEMELEVDAFDFTDFSENEGFIIPEPLDPAEFYTD